MTVHADCTAGRALHAWELFPCSGGMAEGFRRAGVTFAHAFDYDKDACDSYEHNHGHRPIQMDVRDLLRMVRGGVVPSSPLALVVADPPCTPWSRSGKRLGLEDERDMLADTCALLAELGPVCWLIGNVPGLDDSTNAGALDRTMGVLRERWCIDYMSLDAADFGVPQHRVRPFWFGHPKGTPCIRWPLPTHGRRVDQLHIAGTELAPWVTCRDALQHLPLEHLGKPIVTRRKDDTNHRVWNVPGEPAKALTRNTHGDGALLTHPRHPINRPDEPSYTITAKGDCRGAQGSCVLEWPWDRPSTTVFTEERLLPPGHHPESGSIMSQPNAVKLSELAGAILQGFPETWRFSGKSKKARWAQIGMAMPPGLAEPVARSIVRWFAANARERAA